MFTLSLARVLPAVLALGGLSGWAKPLVAALPVAPGIVDAATPTTQPQKKESTAESTAESTVARRATLQKEIAATREELAKVSDATSVDSARWLTEETALLERIDSVYGEQQRTWQHAADLAKEAADVAEETRNRRPPEATFKLPYDMPMLEQLYGERDYLERAGALLKRDIGNAETALRDARDALEDKDRDRRAVRGVRGNVGDGAKAPGNLRLAELESRLAQETVLLTENALKTLKLQQSLLEPKEKLLRPRLDWLRAHLNLAAEDSAAAQLKQQKHATELERAIAAAKKEVEAVTQIVIATERRGATEKSSDELDSRRANRQTANLTLSVLIAQRERPADEAKVSALRRRVLSGGMVAKELRALAEENQEAIDQLIRVRKAEATELFRGRRELQDWQGRLTRAAAADEKPAPWGVDRVKRLSAWLALSQTDVAELDQLTTARNRLKEEIALRVNLFSWKDATAVARENVAGAWNYELFSVKDEPVRVKTILAVLLLVVLGHRASRWGSELVSRTVFKRMGMNTGRRAAWQTLWFYAMFIVVLVVAFDLFHISLTQFSVVSGALAVGIGFGSQNLISNFISGVILLIERPVNQGDVIEIDGRQVTVESLGIRSTIVRTADNTHMIVPNSRLLEQPVINWTLSDDVVRKHIQIGVAYDSPTRRVSELLQGILPSIESVRKEPAPAVKFADFGENSLIFEVYFWVSISAGVDAENELRHRIAEVFAQEKIVMAFPQRDVHLETTEPLQVVIAPASGGDNDKPPGGLLDNDAGAK